MVTARFIRTNEFENCVRGRISLGWYSYLVNLILRDARYQSSSSPLATALLPAEATVSLAEETAPATVVITENHPGKLSLITEGSATGLLVISNIDYPGWQATLDDLPVEIYRTNGIFQGVVVPEGRHTLTLVFTPSTFWRGVWLSVFGLFLAGGILLMRIVFV